MTAQLASFLESKAHSATPAGFEPLWMPSFLKEHQSYVVDWALRIGRGAGMVGCGLGKTPMGLVWAENVARKADKPVLILTPLAVAPQWVREGEKFGVEVFHSRQGEVRRITVTNYERLHYFNPADFAGVVGDEISVIKQFKGATTRAVTNFLRKIPLRFLETATAAPNDHIEFGTISEALGYMGRMDFVGAFFKSDENSLHPTGFRNKWIFKAHGEEACWRYLSSICRAMRQPSDLGFSNEGYDLPPLNINEHIVSAPTDNLATLFAVQALTEAERRAERKATTKERCETAAALHLHDDASIAWCDYNEEGDLLTRLIPGSVQVTGSDSDDKKEEILSAFSRGDIRKLVTKDSIAGFGLNWHHCNHMTRFPNHSAERYYQSVRRCWRFGQTRPVGVDIVASEGERGVAANTERKMAQIDAQFDALIAQMGRPSRLDVTGDRPTEVPAWVA